MCSHGIFSENWGKRWGEVSIEVRGGWDELISDIIWGDKSRYELGYEL